MTTTTLLEEPKNKESASPSPPDADSDHDDDDTDDNHDDDEFDFIQSIWENSVETGLIVQWPKQQPQPQQQNNDDKQPIPRPLHLSTKLSEDAIAPLFDGTQWAGTRVWKAAIVALEYCLEHYAPTTTTTSSSLLELGCGLGVPGMLWHLLLEQRVVLTDQPDLLSQLDANLHRNFPNNSSTTSTIQAQALSWSAAGIRALLAEQIQPFDICLNCDCIYEPLYGRDAWEALSDVLSVVAKESPSTILVTSVERRNGDGLENFLERLEGTGNVVTPIQLVLRNDEDPHHIIEIYVTKGIEK
jgi:hypothetical protein